MGARDAQARSLELAGQAAARVAGLPHGWVLERFADYVLEHEN